MKSTIRFCSLLSILLTLTATWSLGDPILLTPDVPSEVPPGEHRLNVRWGVEDEMITRSMIVIVPDGYDSSNEHVLLYAFHPSRGNATKMRNARHGLVARANAHNMILVFPEGLHRFNADSFKWQAAAGDVAFVSQLTQWFTEVFTIDRQQIFVSGMSNGGSMAQSMAVWRPDMVAGAVSFVASSGETTFDPETGEGTHLQIRTPKAPVPIVLVRGGPGDQLVPPHGELNKNNVRSDTVAEQFAFWVEGNECDQEHAEAFRPLPSITIRRAGVCGAGAVVYSVYSEILGHTWPGANHACRIDGDRLVIDFIRSLKPRPRPEIMEFELMMPDQQMRLVFKGRKEHTYLLETTEDLDRWEPASSSDSPSVSESPRDRFIATGEPQTIHVDAHGTSRFYRFADEERDQIPFADAIGK